jgi:hypothetical protein
MANSIKSRASAILDNMMQKEYIRHIQQEAIAQLEEGDELIMTIRKVTPELLCSCGHKGQTLAIWGPGVR